MYSAARMVRTVTTIDHKSPVAITTCWTGCPDMYAPKHRTLQYHSDTAEEETQCRQVIAEISEPMACVGILNDIRKGFDRACVCVCGGGTVLAGSTRNQTRRIPTKYTAPHMGNVPTARRLSVVCATATGDGRKKRHSPDTIPDVHSSMRVEHIGLEEIE